GDSVEALALRGQEGIGRRTRRMVFARSEWLADVPATVVEPRPRVLGAFGFEAVEIVNGPLETDRRFVNQADGREPALRAGQRQYGDGCRALVEDGHMDRISFAPETAQCQATFGEQSRGRAPAAFVHHDTSPGPMVLDPAPIRKKVVERGHFRHRPLLPDQTRDV